MKRLTPHRNFLWALLLPLLFAACDNDEEELFRTDGPTQTIVESAQNSDNLTNLSAALAKVSKAERSNLMTDLTSAGPFTVFAPSDEAFQALLEELGYDDIEDFDAPEKIELLETILAYHVVPGVAAEASDLSSGQILESLQGEDLEILVDEGVFVKDATDVPASVILADLRTLNGIVHVIDKVLLPQAALDALKQDNTEESSNTLVDLVIETEALSALEAAVIKADLVDVLNGAGPFTVFAPTNDAFEALLEVLGENYNSLDDFESEAEIMLLRDILSYHVVAGDIRAADLEAGEVMTLFSENELSIIEKEGSFVIGDATDTPANITGTDFVASNGVAHTIDKVLLPQAALDFVASLQLKTIVEIAVETDDLSLLVEALTKANAGLVETLGEEGPFTVFAPTNQAFVDLLGVLGDDYNSLSDFDTEAEIDLLIDILTYHVVAGTAAFSGDLEDGQQIQTVFGEKVGIDIKGGVVHIEDASETNATVVIPDVKASNGVVHVIDKVLLPQAALDALNPPLPNIVELAQATPQLESLVTALITAEAGFVEFLSGEGPFTVFAPTNEAFEELLDALGDEFHSLADFDTPAEKALLAQVLTYHVAEGEALFSTDLTDHQPIYTVQGEKLFAILSHGVAIRDKTDVDANVQAPDNAASNGVVHIIDKILLPQAVLDALAAPAH
jgi:uncharacterized surface protein with fasciclin (FAS1) repeats